MAFLLLAYRLLLYNALGIARCFTVGYKSMNKYISKNNAFQNCISSAKKSDTREAAEYYRLAIMVDPVAEEGYLGLIECLKERSFSDKSSEMLLKEAFQSSEYDRAVSNIDHLRINQRGYEKVIRAAEGMKRICSAEQPGEE